MPNVPLLRLVPDCGIPDSILGVTRLYEAQEKVPKAHARGVIEAMAKRLLARLARISYATLGKEFYSVVSKNIEYNETWMKQSFPGHSFIFISI